MAVKIVVNGTFLVKTVTGVQRYAREMIKGIHELGFTDLVILTPHDYPYTSFEGFDVYRDPVSIPLKENWWIWEQARLPVLYRKFHGYVLWSPGNIGPLAVKNQIITIHDAAVFAGPQWFSAAGGCYYRWMIPSLARRVKHILTDSVFSQNELIKYGIAPREQISVVPCGIDLEYFVSNETVISNRQEYVLNIGSRDPRKNIKKLIEAWKQIDKELKNGVNLVLVGGYNRGFSNENLNELDSDIQLVGYKTDVELKMLYKNAILFIYPSLYEGFGMPPLEAMANGIPVIVSNVASLPEVCGESAIYCDPYDESDIADKLSILLRDNLLRKTYGKKGLEHVQQFSWTTSARKFLDIVAFFG